MNSGISFKRSILGHIAYNLLALSFATHAFAQSSTTGSVKGKVIDPERSPVSNALVRIVNDDNGNEYATRTDEYGEFSHPGIIPGPYTLTVTRTQYPDDYFSHFAIELGLDKGVGPHPPIFTVGLTTCTGQVLDSKGNPIADMLVRVIPVDVKSRDWDRKDLYWKRTDRAGNYRIPYLRLGTYRLLASGSQQFSRRIIIQMNSDGRAPADHDCNIRLRPLAHAGLVTDPNERRPLIAAAPTILNPAKYYDRKTERRPVMFMRFPPLQIRQAPNKLTSRITDSTGKGLTDVNITVMDESTEDTYGTMTDRNGDYYITDIPPGTYTIAASKVGFNEARLTGVQIKAALGNTDVPAIKLTETVSSRPKPQDTRPEESTEQPALINLFGVARSTNFNERQINSLPLGGTTQMRTFDELALLMPGVSPPPDTPGVRGPGIGFGIGTAGKFSVNGMRARSNNFSVDGSDDNDSDVGVRRQGFVTLVPQSLESIKELQVLTLLWDAELGRNFGSQVNAVSRYGWNDYHGQAYGFFTDSRLNARNFFDDTGSASGGKDPFTRTQIGGVIGGPIVRNHLQFFASFEHQSLRASTEQHFSTPTLAERRFLGLPRFRIIPISTEFPSNFFFDTDLGATPLGQNFLSLYPKPNNPNGPYGKNTYSEVLPADGTGTVLSFKLTEQIAEKNILNARYNLTDDSRVLPSVNRAIHSTINSATRTQNLSIILDSNLTSTLFAQTRFSYGRTQLHFSEHSGSPFVFSRESTHIIDNPPFGSVPVPSMTGSIGELIVEPFSPIGVDTTTFPQGRVNNTFQYAGSISWIHGKHSVKFGGDIRRIQLNSRQDRNYRPLVIFGSGLLEPGSLAVNSTIRFIPSGEPDQFLPGVQLASLGLPSSIFQTISAGTPNSTVGLRFNEISLFFNDSWKARPGLTFDYGVRYEYNTIPHEVNSLIERAIKLENLPRVGQSTINTNARTSAFNAAIDSYRMVLDGRENTYNSDKDNFGPHLGFAWNPQFDGKTMVRGGYGIYYDAVLGAVVSQSRNVFPNEIPIDIDPSFLGFDVFNANLPAFLQIKTDPSGNRLTPIPLIAPGTLNQLGGAPNDFIPLIGEVFRQSLGGGLAFTLPAKKLPTPFAQQWHLTIDRELFRDFLVSAAYVGTKGSKLTRLTTPNLGPNVTPRVPFAQTSRVQPVDIPFVITNLVNLSLAPARPNPSLGPYQVFENSSKSNYHALQLEVRKRYSHGYAFTAAYTWSHAIDDVSDIFPIAGAPILPQDSSNLSLERASANFDVRHRFATSLIWDLPFYRHSNTGVARWLGGWQIASIFQANTGQPFTLNLSIDANFDGNLTDRPSTVDGLIFFQGHGPRRVAISQERKITDFFVFGQDGLVGRNTARGDSFVNWDLAVHKLYQINERQKIELRTEFFNLLNRTNFGLPIRFLDSPGFGASVDTVNPARIIQLVLKYSF
jgi:protocatechuate 3,4-dioxygenase beta subunit